MRAFFKMVDKAQDAVVKTKVFRKIKSAITFHPTYVWHSRHIRYPAPIDQTFSRDINIPQSDLSPYDLKEQDPREKHQTYHIILNPAKKYPEDYKDQIQHSFSSGPNPHVTVAEWKIPENGYIPRPKSYEDIKVHSSFTEAEFKKMSEFNEPMHLPHEHWIAEAGAIIDDYMSKGLPPVPGKPFPWHIPKQRNEHHW